MTYSIEIFFVFFAQEICMGIPDNPVDIFFKANVLNFTLAALAFLILILFILCSIIKL